MARRDHAALRQSLAVVISRRRRQWVPAWARLGMGALVLGSAFLIMLAPWAPARVVASDLVLTLIAGGFGLVGGFGTLISVWSALEQEKSQRTFGMLSITALSTTDLLILMALPRLIGTCLLLALTLPVACIAGDLGAVTWTRLGVIYLGLPLWCVLAAALGLVMGTAGLRWGAKINLAPLLGIVVAVGGLSLADRIGWTAPNDVLRRVFDCTPLMAFNALGDPLTVAAVFAAEAALALAAFAAACRLLPAGGLDDAPVVPAAVSIAANGGKAVVEFWPQHGRVPRPPAGTAQALTWLAFHRGGGWRGALTTVLIACIFAAAVLVFMAVVHPRVHLHAAPVLAVTATLMVIAVHLSIQFSALGTDLRLGTTDTLLTLPLTTVAHLRAKQRAAIPLLAPGAALAAGAAFATPADDIRILLDHVGWLVIPLLAMAVAVLGRLILLGSLFDLQRGPVAIVMAVLPQVVISSVIFLPRPWSTAVELAALAALLVAWLVLGRLVHARLRALAPG